MRKPDFFVVGAPKCGTTAMISYLAQHPEVFVSPKKEPHFFGTDLVSPGFVRDEVHYLSLFSAARDEERRLGEGSIWYLYSERAAAEIKAFEPRAKIIIMLRDPVEALYSLHSQHLYSGEEDIEDFEAALDAEEDRKEGLRIPKHNMFAAGLFYRETAKYAEQVQRYLDVFGRENVRVVIYDDFMGDPAGAYGETLRFLGVGPDHRADFRPVNPNTRVRSELLREYGYRNPPQAVKLVARAVMSPQSRERLNRMLKVYNTRYEDRWPMDAELARSLRAEFAPEVERLSGLLGRDLTHWSRT